MSYLVLARKWRPQAFADMTGQEHVVRTLANAIAQDRVAHAYLFCGPRGVGKTTAARLLAKALNCEKGPTATPCGVCAPCKEIAAGNDLDVAEIDGASNNGVENVREIREAARFLPQRDRNKIYIIDEVHMLSGAAFNALLKTLEEPPPHVKFIFATTEPHKLPDTILSRCQRHNFRRIPTAMMIARLREILSAEKAKLSDRSLALVARQSEGGMRDALSLLDQILSACGNEPTDEQVSEALGAIDRTQVHKLTKALLERNAKETLAVVEELFVRGVDLKRLAEELSLYLRHVMVAKATNEAPDEVAESEKKAILELAAPADPTHVARLFDLAHQAIWDVGRAAQPRLALEVALLKGVHLAPGASVEALIERIESLSSKLGTGGPSANAGASAPIRPGPTFQVAGGAAAATARSLSAPSPTSAPSSAPARTLSSVPSPVDTPRAQMSVPETATQTQAQIGAHSEAEADAELGRVLEVDSSPGGCATGECLPETTAEAKTESSPLPSTPSTPTTPAAPPAAPSVPSGMDDPRRPLADRWKAALEQVKKVNPRIADSLSHGRVLAMNPGQVSVCFTGNQAAFHRMQSERPTHKADIDRGLGIYFGTPTALKIEKDVPAELTATPTVQAQASTQPVLLSPAEEEAQRRSDRELRLRKAAREHPAVQAAVALLGGTLQEIRVREEIARPVEAEDPSPDD